MQLKCAKRVCKVFVEIRTTPIVGAGLRGMPYGIPRDPAHRRQFKHTITRLPLVGGKPYKPDLYVFIGVENPQHATRACCVDLDKCQKAHLALIHSHKRVYP